MATLRGGMKGIAARAGVMWYCLNTTIMASTFRQSLQKDIRTVALSRSTWKVPQIVGWQLQIKESGREESNLSVFSHLHTAGQSRCEVGVNIRWLVLKTVGHNCTSIAAVLLCIVTRCKLPSNEFNSFVIRENLIKNNLFYDELHRKDVLFFLFSFSVIWIRLHITYDRPDPRVGNHWSRIRQRIKINKRSKNKTRQIVH